MYMQNHIPYIIASRKNTQHNTLKHKVVKSLSAWHCKAVNKVDLKSETLKNILSAYFLTAISF